MKMTAARTGTLYFYYRRIDASGVSRSDHDYTT